MYPGYGVMQTPQPERSQVTVRTRQSNVIDDLCQTYRTGSAGRQDEKSSILLNFLIFYFNLLAFSIIRIYLVFRK